MASSPTPSTDDPLHDPPGSNQSLDPNPSDDSSTLKLGDFTRLGSQSLSLWASRKERHTPGSPITLGNFRRLFDQLGVKDPNDPPMCEPPSPPKTKPITILKRPRETHSNADTIIAPVDPAAEPLPGLVIDSETGSGSDTDFLPITSYSTAASTPPSAAESPLETFTKTKQTKKKTPKAKDKSHGRNASQTNIVVCGGLGSELVRRVISYQHVKYGPITEIHGHAKARDAKHEALMGKLVHQRVFDSVLCKEVPNIASNGIHVFVDMSNIIIGFQKALKAKFSLSESTRFVPLPQMNLSFLHELLVRERHTEWLNVGCSMHPGRGEPTFIKELKDLGYRVDLRHRRPEQASAEEHTTFEAGGFRYVEDMVDETLQIRIGESVMQYFDKPGTLVLATGDARPAKYSDGFLAYAQRALKMGWSVEVVSWKSSLSSAWKGLCRDESVGSRIRVIELDQFLDELWIC
ncbi:hypothetical protein FZEAL_8985 [Fusarium zealandicum]|uniref:Uncharacterized protein n=1 Tax=Fusarium zealandicum TaxID=1053134 RepID=A0A8H4XGZ1_9HYPO|nr:hypothetical protein FZEAL_8985 [Fusarium zealandicum]